MLDINLDEFKWEAFVEEAVDLGAARKLVGVHLVPRAFNALLEVHTKLLHHPDKGEAQKAWGQWEESTLCYSLPENPLQKKLFFIIAVSFVQWCLTRVVKY